MSSDGGLGQLFQKHLPGADWQRIETGGTGLGIPDLNGCHAGVEVWVENKWTNGWKVKVRPEQVGWLERRARHGGRVFVAVRQTGPMGRDDLWLLHSDAARLLIDGVRLDLLPADLLLGRWSGGPAAWEWKPIHRILFEG
jgi:Holliday junction resolvase